MFDFFYSRAFLDKILKEIKLLFHIINILTQIITIGYLTYSAIVENGNRWINVALATISLLYLAFYLLTYKKKDNNTAKAKQTAKHLKTTFNILIKTYTLAVLLYSVYTAATNVTPLSVVMAGLMVIGWILQVLFEALTYYIESRKEIAIAAFSKDMQDLKDDFKRFIPFLKKSNDEEASTLEPEKSVVRMHKVLGDTVEQLKEEKQKKKEDKLAAAQQAKLGKKISKQLAKEEKKTQKELLKQQKKEQKLIKKQEKKNKHAQHFEKTQEQQDA